MRSERTILFALLLAVTLAGVLFRFWGVMEQPPLDDEMLTVFTASNYVERGQVVPIMPQHPPLRNLLEYLSTRLLGTNALGVRAFSLVLGSLSPLLLGLLLYRLTGGVGAAALAALFLAIDPVHIMFSRQAIQEVHTTFFFLLGTFLALSALRAQADGTDRKYLPFLLAAGVAFGLGLASKAHAVVPMLVCAGMLVMTAIRNRDLSGAAVAFFALTVLPLTVYLWAYLPWFGRGYSLADWVFMQFALSHNYLADFGHSAASAVDARAWEWFVRPFVAWGNFAFSNNRPYVSIAMGNPLLWLSILPASVYLWFRPDGRRKVLVLQALFWASYLPLVIAKRPITIFTALAVLPFAYGLLGLALERWNEHKPRWVLATYVALAVIATLMIYPMSIGKTLDYGYPRTFIEKFDPNLRETQSPQ